MCLYLLLLYVKMLPEGFLLLFWICIAVTILVVIAGGKNVALVQNWKVDPRCPHASNPFHMCAQYCFDHLNETAQTSATKSGVLFWSPWNFTHCTHGIHSIAVRVSELWLIYLYFAIYLFIFQIRKKARLFLKKWKEKLILIVPTHPTPTTRVVNTVRGRVIGSCGR